MVVLTHFVQQGSFVAARVPHNAMTAAVLILIAWSASLDWTLTPDGTTEWILEVKSLQIYIKNLQAEMMERVGFH